MFSAAPEKQLRVFRLVNAEPAAAANTLTRFLPKGVQAAVDVPNRSVIVSGSPGDMKEVEALVLRLDEIAKKEVPKAPANYDVRLVWLGYSDKSPMPSDDLKDVVAELSRLGVNGIRQVCQLTVRTTGKRSFSTTGFPTFGGKSAEITADGILHSVLDDGRLTLEMKIHTKVEGSLGAPSMATQLVIPQGQYVVLATVPTETMTSAFVVQVTPSN